MRVDLYARVSTQEQNVEQQILHLRKWAILKGFQISSETYDKQSGTVDLRERKSFLNLLNHPKGDAMLVYNLDRLTRNWDSVTFLEKHFRNNWENYKLISTKDTINLITPNGRLMFRIQLAVNCAMPEDMLEKQRIGIDRALKEGKFKGRKKGAVARNKYSSGIQNLNSNTLNKSKIINN
jgi:DNA invertase Pin-like site-specific DNA recombinase